jgi:hypothetical protein
VDPKAKATLFRPIPNDEHGSPFKYLNTASSRAGIDALNAKLRSERVAIVGLGGSGEYILDFVAKTEVETIDAQKSRRSTRSTATSSGLTTRSVHRARRRSRSLTRHR